MQMKKGWPPCGHPFFICIYYSIFSCFFQVLYRGKRKGIMGLCLAEDHRAAGQMHIHGEAFYGTGNVCGVKQAETGK